MSTSPDQRPPSAPPPEPPDPYTTHGASLGESMDDRNIAMLTHLSGIILCFVVPLVVWLTHKDRADKEYLVSEAKEALNFQLTVLIGYVICWILTAIVIGKYLAWLLWLIDVVSSIVAALQVSRNGTYRYPYCLRLVN